MLHYFSILLEKILNSYSCCSSLSSPPKRTLCCFPCLLQSSECCWKLLEYLSKMFFFLTERNKSPNLTAPLFSLVSFRSISLKVVYIYDLQFHTSYCLTQYFLLPCLSWNYIFLMFLSILGSTFLSFLDICYPFLPSHIDISQMISLFLFSFDALSQGMSTHYLFPIITCISQISVTALYSPYGYKIDSLYSNTQSLTIILPSQYYNLLAHFHTIFQIDRQINDKGFIGRIVSHSYIGCKAP